MSVKSIKGNCASSLKDALEIIQEHPFFIGSRLVMQIQNNRLAILQA